MSLTLYLVISLAACGVCFVMDLLSPSLHDGPRRGLCDYPFNGRPFLNGGIIGCIISLPVWVL